MSKRTSSSITSDEDQNRKPTLSPPPKTSHDDAPRTPKKAKIESVKEEKTGKSPKSPKSPGEKGTPKTVRYSSDN
jgi:hypothetical protein